MFSFPSSSSVFKSTTSGLIVSLPINRLSLLNSKSSSKLIFLISPSSSHTEPGSSLLRPTDRLQAILKMRRDVLQTQTRLQSQSVSSSFAASLFSHTDSPLSRKFDSLDQFGVHISRDPSQAPARQLFPPTIEYQSQKPTERRSGVPPRFVSVKPNPNDGAWKQTKRGPNVVEKLITPSRPLDSAVVVLANQSMLQGARNFFGAFFRSSEALGQSPFLL